MTTVERSVHVDESTVLASGQKAIRMRDGRQSYVMALRTLMRSRLRLATRDCPALSSSADAILCERHLTHCATSQHRAPLRLTDFFARMVNC